jgi:hypothetical protein
MAILSEAKSEAVSRMVADALESASTASVISALVEDRWSPDRGDFHPSVITVKTTDGQELKISTLSRKSSSSAELVSENRTIDAAPSGTFVLVSGKTLAIEKGRLVGGTAAAGEIRDWAVFSLMADPHREPPGGCFECLR